MILGFPTENSIEIKALSAGAVADTADEAGFCLREYIAEMRKYFGRIPDLYFDDVGNFSGSHQFENLERKLLDLVDV